MEVTLWSILGWNSKRLSSEEIGDHILVFDALDCVHGGSPILYQVMAAYLHSGNHVCLISTENTLTHYVSVIRKLGLNLASPKYRQSFSFVDCLGMGCEVIASRHTEHPAPLPSYLKQVNVVTEFQDGKQIWGLIKQISADEAEVEAPNRKPCLFVIDNVSTLSILLNGMDQVRKLLDYIRHDWEKYEQSSLSLMALAHSDSDSLASQQLLARQFDTVIRMQGLSTGRSLEIDGQLQCIKKRKSCVQHPPTVLYRVLDTNVRYIQC